MSNAKSTVQQIELQLLHLWDFLQLAPDERFFSGAVHLLDAERAQLTGLLHGR
ncbi:hypothetical protein [Pseudomonas luteola]|uniref:hypothetical protein n=1 Tax=Pseudomonas luteola TaxID=47886 RepID=UPI00289F56A7|nr:hypothetical protein [Pseudomonas luteola]